MAKNPEEPISKVISALQWRLGISFGGGMGAFALTIHNGSLLCAIGTVALLAVWMGLLIGLAFHTFLGVMKGMMED